MWGWNWLEDLGKDVRYVCRNLQNNLLFATVAVLALALGIGANTAIYSIINAVLLRTLPVHDPQQLVPLRVLPSQPENISNTGDSNTSFGGSVFEQLRQQRRIFSDLVAYVPAGFNQVSVRVGKTPAKATVDLVSGSFLSGLGVPVLCSASLALWGQQTASSIKEGTKAAQPAGPITSARSADTKTWDDTILFLRRRNSHEYERGATGVDEAMYVPIGGIDQWMTLRGYDRRNPVLLFLHGGPGDVTNPWSFPYFATWEKYFTVVQWDQRGSGRTLKKTGPSIASSMTLDRMTRDGIEVSEFLRKHLGKTKIVVVGHSFGSLLGLCMVRERPDLYAAYVGTGQVATETEYLEADYRALVQKAQNTENREAQADLRRIGSPPFPYGSDGFYVLHKWANLFEGANAFLGGEMGLALVSPAGNSIEDLNNWTEGQNLSADQLWPQIKTITQKDLGYEFHVPMFFFQGTEDFTSPTELARQYMNEIKAPQKAFVPLAGGHFTVFMHSDAFLKELIGRVLPLAQDKSRR